jgi:predicted TIM-barrel fold metal-dependent hydrolase
VLIPLFDSLAHPTLTGDWGPSRAVAHFDHLMAELEGAGFAAACAIGMAGVGGYEHEAFIDRCRPYPRLVPIAGFDPSVPDAGAEIGRLARLGFRGIKLHPRYSGVTRDLDALGAAFRAAAGHDLVVFYCTYMHGPLASYPRSDPLYDLVSLLEAAPEVRAVLVHGGDVNLLRYAELVRFNHNLLLDLSLTMMKYQGSSLDMDLRFLFEKFDRRICVGTDYPEYSHGAVRSRFEQLSHGLAPDKVENAAFGNLSRLLRWPQ